MGATGHWNQNLGQRILMRGRCERRWKSRRCNRFRRLKVNMRSLLIAFMGLMLITTTAQAKVQITIDKNNQLMTVAVDGVEKYRWPVSSGIPSRETPNGTFRAFRMEADHFSKEFDDSPMPHSIFFTKVGHAIHGTDSEGRLGTPASHGCVRLSKANATTLYALVQQQGVLNTTVTLTGSAAVALARNPRRGTAVARRDTTGQYDQQYAATGQPMDITRRAPPDDAYIYPADGSSTDQRYPAPRRQLYDAQAYPQPQPQPRYYNNQGYQQPQPAPQGYYQQRQYYQQRGFFN